MSSLDAGSARGLLEAAVVAISLLGGTMAYFSGYAAAQAISEQQPPDILGQRINEGIGEGFSWGWPAAILALIIMTWT